MNTRLTNNREKCLINKLKCLIYKLMGNCLALILTSNSKASQKLNVVIISVLGDIIISMTNTGRGGGKRGHPMDNV